MVAFLRALPQLSADQYWRLAVGEPRHPGASPPMIEMCAACHGVDGRGRDGGAFPAIAGQNAQYLRRALDAYAAGQRHSGMMGPIAAAIDPRTRDALIAYYAELPSTATRGAGADAARGEAIALRGIPEAHPGMPRVPSAGRQPEARVSGPRWPACGVPAATAAIVQRRRARRLRSRFDHAPDRDAPDTRGNAVARRVFRSAHAKPLNVLNP